MLAVISLLNNIRVNTEELVDNPEIPMADALATVLDQAVVNNWLGGANATLAHAIPLLRECASNPVRILDIACGGGDLSRRLAQSARHMGKHIDITGLDLNRQVITCARELCVKYPEIHFVTGDALYPPFVRGEFDIVILSTFMHHLQPEQIVPLLSVARNLSRGFVILADLVRSPLAYIGFGIFARLMRFDPITIHDGLASVRRAYTPAELQQLASDAGIHQYTLTQHMISRMTLVYPGINDDDKEGNDELSF